MITLLTVITIEVNIVFLAWRVRQLQKQLNRVEHDVVMVRHRMQSLSVRKQLEGVANMESARRNRKQTKANAV